MHRLVVALLFVACTKSHDQAPPPSGGSVPVIPDTILTQLGPTAEMIIAVDFGHMDSKSLLARIPDDAKCSRDVLGAIGIGIVATGKDTGLGFVTNAPEATTIACVKQFAAVLGLEVHDVPHGFELAIPDEPIVATWRDGVTTIVQRGHDVPKGKPDPELMTLLAQVPRDAKGLIVQHGEPKKVIKTLVGWLQTREQKFIVTLVFVGLEPGGAHKTTTEMIEGFKLGAGQKGVTLDDKWFEIKDDGLTSTLVATIPYDAIAGSSH